MCYVLYGDLNYFYLGVDLLIAKFYGDLKLSLAIFNLPILFREMNDWMIHGYCHTDFLFTHSVQFLTFLIFPHCYITWLFFFNTVIASISKHIKVLGPKGCCSLWRAGLDNCDNFWLSVSFSIIWNQVFIVYFTEQIWFSTVSRLRVAVRLPTSSWLLPLYILMVTTTLIDLLEINTL